MTMAFSPAAGSNAIEACSLNLRFLAAVNDSTFDAIAAVAGGIAQANDLPATQQHVSPQFTFGLNGSPSVSQSIGRTVSFQRYAPNGTVQVELKCESQSLTLLVRKYDSWKSYLDQIESVICPILELYMQNLPAISNVALQYDDAFIAVPSTKPPVAREMFRDDTKWATLSEEGSAQPWHSHYGTFILDDDGTRRLVNVNVTVNDQVRMPHLGPQRVVTLSTLTSEVHDANEDPIIVEPGTERETLMAILNTLHDMQKRILSEVLNDTYLASIGG